MGEAGPHAAPGSHPAQPGAQGALVAADDPDFAGFLVRAGIESISLNPDSVIDVIRHVSRMA